LKDSIQILVADTEPVVSRDVQQALERMGYQVPGVTASGPDLLRLASELSPDLVIMDVMLEGDLDGIETADILREKHGVPVIFLTAIADEETIARARDTEPFGYLLKPYNDRELQSAVEMALSQSESRQRIEEKSDHFVSTLRSMADGVIATNLVGNITFINPLAERLTGWPAADAIGRPLQDVFQITDPESGRSAPAFPKASKGATRAIRLTCKDGSQISIEDNSAPLKSEDGSLDGLVIVFRKRPEFESTASDGPPLVGLVEGIADPLIAVDVDWQITYANRQAARYFDKAPSEMIGRDIWDEFPGDVHSRYYNEYFQALTRRERRSFEIYSEEKKVWFEVTAYPFGDGLLLLLKDITARKGDEERHQKVEKLESLGLLARGFAHDFNNLLTVLMGNLSLAEEKLPEGIDGLEEIAAARKASIDAQSRVQQLLTFAKGGAPVRKLVDTRSIISAALSGRSKKNGVEYRGKIADNLWWAKLDANQIGRLLDNLLQNAEQALLGEDGKITVTCTNVATNADTRDAYPDALGLEQEEHYIIIEIADNGQGIAPEHLNKVFEPYYSTRQEANATGIGLTVCESIVRGHLGGIAIKSDIGKGTSVFVALPALGEPDESIVVEDDKSAGDANRGPKRILILEDEQMIRQLLHAQLSKKGYEVDEVEEGGATIALFSKALEEKRPYDLLIMDLSIPNGMGGAKAMAEIRKLDSDVLAIVSSGYSDDPVMANPKKYGFDAVLPKPYQPGELIEMVASMIGL
jgi:two-component system cell cycle sensor histidine kinase/response regulator CckA